MKKLLAGLCLFSCMGLMADCACLSKCCDAKPVCRCERNKEGKECDTCKAKPCTCKTDCCCKAKPVCRCNKGKVGCHEDKGVKCNTCCKKSPKKSCPCKPACPCKKSEPVEVK